LDKSNQLILIIYGKKRNTYLLVGCLPNSQLLADFKKFLAQATANLILKPVILVKIARN
jgi:hypothetical protein